MQKTCACGDNLIREPTGQSDPKCKLSPKLQALELDNSAKIPQKITRNTARARQRTRTPNSRMRAACEFAHGDSRRGVLDPRWGRMLPWGSARVISLRRQSDPVGFRGIPLGNPTGNFIPSGIPQQRDIYSVRGFLAPTMTQLSVCVFVCVLK